MPNETTAITQVNYQPVSERVGPSVRRRRLQPTAGKRLRSAVLYSGRVRATTKEGFPRYPPSGFGAGGPPLSFTAGKGVGWSQGRNGMTVCCLQIFRTNDHSQFSIDTRSSLFSLIINFLNRLYIEPQFLLSPRRGGRGK
jgi:hypothetical protein